MAINMSYSAQRENLHEYYEGLNGVVAFTVNG